MTDLNRRQLKMEAPDGKKLKKSKNGIIEEKLHKQL
jgi:hypothetical protein